MLDGLAKKARLKTAMEYPAVHCSFLTCMSYTICAPEDSPKIIVCGSLPRKWQGQHLQALDKTLQQEFHRCWKHSSKHAPTSFTTLAVSPTNISWFQWNQHSNRMKLRKSPGPGNIPLDLIQNGGLPFFYLFFKGFSRSSFDYRKLRVFADPKNGIITIFKKGDCSICGNFRDTSMLSIARKIFARILLNCLQVISEKFLPKLQCGFCVSRGTISMIFCARQLQEKSREQQKHLFLVAENCYVYGSKTLWLP